jgi:uncharacterized membrane protein YfcA
MPSIILDVPFYAVAIPAVIALGLSKGGFSGLGAIATPLVALYLSPLSAAALLLPIMICQDLISLYVYRKDWSPWNLRVLLPGALVGVVLGYVFATHISDAGVRIVSGGIGIAFAMSAWFRRKNTTSHKATAAGGALWGAISGFTSFVVQGGGPAFQAHVLPQRLPKMTFVGTSTIFFFIVNALKVFPYFLLGEFNSHNLATSIALLPLAIASNFLGFWLVRYTSVQWFYRIAYTLLVSISLGLLWQGVNDMLKA